MNEAIEDVEVKDVRITDGYIRRIVEDERLRRGDKTMAKTAAQMILERYAQLEQRRIPQPSPISA
jgi:hypothetical protein